MRLHQCICLHSSSAMCQVTKDGELCWYKNEIFKTWIAVIVLQLRNWAELIIKIPRVHNLAFFTQHCCMLLTPQPTRTNQTNNPHLSTINYAKHKPHRCMIVPMMLYFTAEKVFCSFREGFRSLMENSINFFFKTFPYIL